MRHIRTQAARSASGRPLIEARSTTVTNLTYFSTAGDLVQRRNDPQITVASGMIAIFNDMTSNGHLAVAVMQNGGSQVANTGLTMSVAFWDPVELEWYEILIPTTLGETEVPAANIFTGVYSALGGADTSDAVAGEVDGQPAVFFCSALPYWGSRISVYGRWPVIATFTINATTGRWEYNQSKSIFTSDLGATDPTHWRPLTNVWGETFHESRGIVEMDWLPASKMLACSLYYPMPSWRSGAVCVIDPQTKTQRDYLELPEMTTVAGNEIFASPRDMITDPTGTLGNEVFNSVCDCTDIYNEKIQIGIVATGGSWTLTYNGNTTTTIPWASSAATVQAAIEALPGIGVGNVEVSRFYPFLVPEVAEYNVEFIGALVETNLAPFTLNKGSLVDGTTSAITQVTTGGVSSGHFPFFAIEFNWDATTDTITQLTVPYHPITAGSEVPSDRADSYSGNWSMGKYTAEGDLVLGSGRWGTNFSDALHIFRKIDGVRALETITAPTAGWESRVGEARIAGDVISAEAGLGITVAPAIIHDDKRRIYTVGQNGDITRLTPTPDWEPRSAELLANPTLATNASGWASFEGSHSVSWSALDGGRAVLTTGATGTATIRTPSGLSGVLIPASFAGQELQFAVTVKAGTTKRLASPFLTYYSAAGSPVSLLDGYGPVCFAYTDRYRTIRFSVIPPAGAAFMTVNVAFLNCASGETFFLQEASLRLPPFTTSAIGWDRATVDNDVINKGSYDPRTGTAYYVTQKDSPPVPVLVTASLARWAPDQ